LIPVPVTPSLWLDPSQSSTLTLVSGAVSEWRDARASLVAAKQATVASQPLLVTNALNGLPVVRFDGSNDYLDLTVGQPMGDFTIAMITKLSGQNYAPQFGITTASGFTPVWYFSSTGGSWRSNASGNPEYFVSYGATFTGQTSVAVLRRTGNQLMASIDGTAYSAVTCTTTAQTLSRIGARGLGAWANYYPGDMGEVLIWNQALTNDQRQRVEAYLAYKWGFDNRLPVGHPYAAANISGNCIVSGNGGAEQVVIRDANTRVTLGIVTPDEATGDWSASVPPGDYDITYFAPNCQPVCHGSYTVTA